MTAAPTAADLTPGRPVVFRNATMLTMDDAHRMLRGADVLISGEQTAAVGEGLEVPEGTAEIDATGTLALAFVLAGTVAEFAGIVTAGWSVATADPTAYVAERHRTPGLGPGSLPAVA